MVKIKRISDAMRHKIGIVLLAGLVWLISLPTASVQAGGYYSEKAHELEVSKPYYSTKERRIAQADSFKPYYSSNNRQKQKANRLETRDEYIDGRRRSPEVIPEDVRSGNQQKIP